MKIDMLAIVIAFMLCMAGAITAKAFAWVVGIVIGLNVFIAVCVGINYALQSPLERATNNLIRDLRRRA